MSLTYEPSSEPLLNLIPRAATQGECPRRPNTPSPRTRPVFMACHPNMTLNTDVPATQIPACRRGSAAGGSLNRLCLLAFQKLNTNPRISAAKFGYFFRHARVSFDTSRGDSGGVSQTTKSGRERGRERERERERARERERERVAGRVCSGD